MFTIVSCTMLILLSYRQQSSIPFTSVETLCRFFPTGSFANFIQSDVLRWCGARYSFKCRITMQL